MEAGDPEWAARVAAHRARRPAWWRTAETTDLAGVLAGASGALLIDGIGTWLAAAMDECGTWDGSAEGAARLAARIGGLVGAWRQTRAHVVAVSDEAGWGWFPRRRPGGCSATNSGGSTRCWPPSPRRPNWSWRGGSCRWDRGEAGELEPPRKPGQHENRTITVR